MTDETRELIALLRADADLMIEHGSEFDEDSCQPWVETPIALRIRAACDYIERTEKARDAWKDCQVKHDSTPAGRLVHLRSMAEYLSRGFGASSAFTAECLRWAADAAERRENERCETCRHWLQYSTHEGCCEVYSTDAHGGMGCKHHQPREEATE